MSGGSYNYLCAAEPADVLARLETVREMAARLDEVCPEAARETRAIEAVYAELEQRVERLRDIWKAAEWCDSADWGEDQLQEAVSEYLFAEGERR